MVEQPGEHGMKVVELQFESLRDLQESFGPYLSTEGFFLEGRQDFDVSDVLRFKLMLPGEFVLIEGTGIVVWLRSPKEASPEVPHGVAVEFATLSDQGRELVERIVASHVEKGGRPFDMSRPELDDSPSSDDESDDDTEHTRPNSARPRTQFSVRETPKEPAEPAPAATAIEETAEPAPPAAPPTAESEPRRPPVEHIPEPAVEPEKEAGSDEADEPLLPFGDTGQRPTEDAPAPDAPRTPETAGPPEETPPDTVDDLDFPAEKFIGDQTSMIIETTPETHADSSETRQIGESGPLAITLPDSDGDASSETADRSGYPLGENPQPRRRLGLFAAVAAIAVLIGAGWLVATRYPDLLPWTFPSGETVSTDTAATTSETTTAEPEDETGIPEAAEVGGEVPQPILSEEEVAAAVEAAVEAATSGRDSVPEPEAGGSETTEAIEEPIPEPTTPSDPVAAPATEIVDIRAESANGGTVILIRGNGSLDEGRIRTSDLASPPRTLIRISGITSDFRPYEIGVGTAEVGSIRIGLHEERQPPSLWIVLDRSDPSVRMRGMRSIGNVVQIEVGQ